jgi:hypothetical protein
MGAPLKHDWKALYREWNRTPAITLEDFCETRSLTYTYASRTFKKFDDEAAEKSKRETARILTNAGPKTALKLLEHIDSADESISLKAVTTNLGIIGFSPQAAANQTQVNVQVNLPSMFSTNENMDELKSLLQGEQQPNGIIEQV